MSTLTVPGCSFFPAAGADACAWVFEEGGGELASEVCASAGTCAACEAMIATMTPMANRIAALWIVEIRPLQRFFIVISGGSPCVPFAAVDGLWNRALPGFQECKLSPRCLPSLARTIFSLRSLASGGATALRCSMRSAGSCPWSVPLSAASGRCGNPDIGSLRHQPATIRTPHNGGARHQSGRQGVHAASIPICRTQCCISFMAPPLPPFCASIFTLST